MFTCVYDQQLNDTAERVIELRNITEEELGATEVTVTVAAIDSTVADARGNFTVSSLCFMCILYSYDFVCALYINIQKEYFLWSILHLSMNCRITFIHEFSNTDYEYIT